MSGQITVRCVDGTNVYVRLEYNVEQNPNKGHTASHRIVSHHCVVVHNNGMELQARVKIDSLRVRIRIELGVLHHHRFVLSLCVKRRSICSYYVCTNYRAHGIGVSTFTPPKNWCWHFRPLECWLIGFLKMSYGKAMSGEPVSVASKNWMIWPEIPPINCFHISYDCYCCCNQRNAE